MTKAGVCGGDEQSAHVDLFLQQSVSDAAIFCCKEPHRASTADRVWSDLLTNCTARGGTY